MSFNALILVIVTLGILITWTIVGVLQRRKRRAQAELSFAFKKPISGEVKTAPQSEAARVEAQQASETGPMKTFNAMPMRIIVTLVLLGAAVYIILSKNYDAASKNWAFGVAGTIVGYWLKPGTGEK